MKEGVTWNRNVWEGSQEKLLEKATLVKGIEDSESQERIPRIKIRRLHSSHKKNKKRNFKRSEREETIKFPENFFYTKMCKLGDLQKKERE